MAHPQAHPLRSDWAQAAPASPCPSAYPPFPSTDRTSACLCPCSKTRAPAAAASQSPNHHCSGLSPA
eukprot:15466371-Alexandrium_andersonii.AAC.1